LLIVAGSTRDVENFAAQTALGMSTSKIPSLQN
jgi:hypothetical protein